MKNEILKINKVNKKNQENTVKAFSSIVNMLKENKKNDFAKSTGGQVLSTAAMFVPGVGQFLSPAITALDQKRDSDLIKDKQIEANQVDMNRLKVNDSPYGNIMKSGGYVNSGFKQYNTGSHDSGMDQTVDANGNPSGNMTAKIQNKENSFKIDGKAFVMSDMLVNPETGNTFNVDAAKTNKKWKNADSLIEEKNALNFEMGRLAKSNQNMINVKESLEKTMGGNIKEYAPGGIIDPPKTNSIFDYGITMDNNVDYTDSVPPSDNLFFNNPSVNRSKLPEVPMIPTLKMKPLEPIKTIEHPDMIDKPFVEQRDNGTQPATTKEPFNYNTLAVGLKGLALGRSIYEGTRDYKNETLIKPDYVKADRQMYKSNFDYTQAKQAALSAANMGSNVNRSASGNFNQYQNRQAQNFGNLADNMSNIIQQENNQNVGLNMNRGQYEANKAVDIANRTGQNRIDNLQNLANRDFATSKIFSDLSSVGTSLNEYQYYKDMVSNKQEIANAKINEGLMLIGSKYQNFGFSDDFVEKLKSGKSTIDEQIKFLSTIEKVKKDGN